MRNIWFVSSMKLTNRVISFACVLSVALLLFARFSDAQEAEGFVAKRADWGRFVGHWEGKWDATWAVRFTIRETAAGEIKIVYAYKYYVTDDDFISKELTNFQMLDPDTLRSGSIRLSIPKVGDGNTLLAMNHGERGVLRSVLTRSK